jgi:hypothetical protein
MQPKSEIIVRDLRDNSVTVIENVALDLVAKSKVFKR